MTTFEINEPLYRLYRLTIKQTESFLDTLTDYHVGKEMDELPAKYRELYHQLNALGRVLRP